MNSKRFGVAMLLAVVILAGIIGNGISPRAWASDRGLSFELLIEEQGTTLRFSVQDEAITSMQIEVRGLDGKRLFQSEWVNASTVIWPLSSDRRRGVSNGVYLYAVRVRDQDGRERQKLGKLALVQGQEPALSVSTVGQLAGTEPAAAQFP
ncbi:hypothetical protein HY230_06675 [Candidatus Acetothermia bacterium]|nr:hypothetical protein [Candidatus Acetothermia bacterium]